MPRSVKIAVPFDYHQTYGYFLKPDVVKALESRGAEIYPLFYLRQELKKLKDMDGLLIPGGINDVDPDRYAPNAVHPKSLVCKNRTDFECEVLNRFLKTKRPVLAICWGIQLVNVCLGGTLFQHLPEERPGEIDHEQKEPAHEPTHFVEFVKDSPGIKLFGHKKMKVNSTHHQAVQEVAPSLDIEGHAEDGLIEALSMRNHEFFWAVQWHPERLRDDPVIPAFLKACQR